MKTALCAITFILLLMSAIPSSAQVGSNPFLLKDINPGVPSSLPINRGCVFGGAYYFTAVDGSSGRELWKTDFTPSGTMLINEFNVGSADGAGYWTHTCNGRLFQNATEGVYGFEPWMSDATGQQWTLLKDIFPNGKQIESSNPHGFIEIGPYTFFAAAISKSTFKLGAPPLTLTAYNYQLFRTDYTTNGTTVVRDLNPTGRSGTNPYGMTVASGLLFFKTDVGNDASTFARSDGTYAGTFPLLSASPGEWAGWDTYEEPVAVGSTVFFIMDKISTGRELWKTDGSTAGTMQVADIHAGSGDASPRFLVTVNGIVYFNADDGINGRSLWRSDGTAAGTYRLPTNSSTLANSDPYWLTPVDNTLYFTASDGVNGRQLWKYDIATDAASLVKVINPTGDCEISNFTPNYWRHQFAVVYGIDGYELFFTATDGAHGMELWRSDGTATGTQLVRDVYPGSSGLVRNIRNLEGLIWFTSDHPLHGVEPWIFDPSQSVNAPPVASFVATPLQGTAPLSVSFDATASYDGDPNGSIVQYDWNFGDGNTASGASASVVTNVYQNPGSYAVLLTVTGSDNETASTGLTITVTSAQSAMHVAAQSVSRVSKPGGKYAGQDAVLVHDNGNSPVAGATVSVSFTGPNTGSSSGITDANGMVILQTPTIRNPVGIWCFTVTDVQLSGYTFQTGHAEGLTCEASTPKSTGTSPIAMELESVFPNPADVEATITLRIPDEGTVRLTLHDLLGRERRVLTDGYTTGGRHVVTFNVADLPSGLYYCRLLHGGQAHIQRLLISR